MAKYRIMPLALSPVIELEPAAFYYKAYQGKPVKLIYGCFVLEDRKSGEVIMVDTGLASQEDIDKYHYPFRRMKDAPALRKVLENKGIDPLKIKTVIFTHLHQDHCFNLELFPNAAMYVQKKELQHAVTPTPIEAKSYQKYDLPGLPSWSRAFGRIVVIEGDMELMDGIKLLLTPGHTPGSQSVVVDTEDGYFYLTGDNYYTQEQFDEGRMNGNFTDLEGWYHSRERILDCMKRQGGRILCVHDPLVYEQEYYG